MLCDTALECKELGKNISEFKEEKWKEEAGMLCLPGIFAKFKSNPCLADMLLSTGDQTIVEATFDTMWGTGIPLHQSDCLDSKKWKGIGLLGEMLMTTRRDRRRQKSAVS